MAGQRSQFLAIIRLRANSAAPDPDYDAGRWWQTEEGLVAAFNEVIKLVFYWAKYGITPFG